MGGRRRRVIESDSDEDMDDFSDFETPAATKTTTSNGNQRSSSSTTPQHRQLQQRLESQAGVRPSGCWLEQCLSHLRSGGSGGNAGNDEAVWNQVLHADLRDVVREESNGNDDDGSSAAAVQLRNAIAQSKNLGGDNNATNGNNGGYRSKKATLPSSFQLLVQMEEVVDTTMNSEQQLASMGGGNAAAATGNGGYNNRNGGQGQQGMRNPKYRCLKIAFSDGYHPDGKSYSSSNNNQNEKENQVMMAMETSPIKSLSTSSPPGVKLLLHGAIDVRFGLLQLNDENCTVLGGEIESWKEVWRKAKEKAQREKGLGVDPTIKALIWNPLMGDEEELDEGEGESGDVTAAPAPPLPPMQQAAPPAPAQPATAPYQQPAARSNNNSRNDMSQNYTSQNMNQNQSTYATNNAPSRGTGGGGGGNNLRQQTLDAFPKKPRPETTRLLPSNNDARSNLTQQRLGNNPYAQRTNNNIMNAHNNNMNAQSDSNRDPPAQQQRQPHQQQLPPPMQRNAEVIPIDDSPPAPTSRKTPMQQPQQQNRAQSNPYASLRPTSAPSNTTNASSQPAAAASSTSSAAPTTFISNPSFSELKSILISLRSNRALYEKYQGKIITVPCKINCADSDNVFNIVKAATPGSSAKKKKSKKEKKYEFLLVGKFLGPKQSDGCISCKVESSVLEPYFDGYGPAEVRKLSREDKGRTTRLVNQSTTQFIHDFSTLGQVEMKLILSPDEFFARMAQCSLPPNSTDWLEDNSNPILLVVKRTGA